jgi:hypothetical protein
MAVRAGRRVCRAEVTAAEQTRIAEHFLLSSPPGEFRLVLGGVSCNRCVGVCRRRDASCPLCALSQT